MFADVLLGDPCVENRLLDLTSLLEMSYLQGLCKHTVDERDRAKHLGCTTTPKISKNDWLPGFLKDQESSMFMGSHI